MKKLLLICTVAITFASCTKQADNAPLSLSTKSKELQLQILGKWTETYNSVTYNNTTVQYPYTLSFTQSLNFYVTSILVNSGGYVKKEQVLNTGQVQYLEYTGLYTINDNGELNISKSNDNGIWSRQLVNNSYVYVADNSLVPVSENWSMDFPTATTMILKRNGTYVTGGKSYSAVFSETYLKQ